MSGGWCNHRSFVVKSLVLSVIFRIIKLIWFLWLLINKPRQCYYYYFKRVFVTMLVEGYNLKGVPYNMWFVIMRHTWIPLPGISRNGFQQSGNNPPPPPQKLILLPEWLSHPILLIYWPINHLTVGYLHLHTWKRQRHVNPIYSIITNIIMMEQEWTDSMYPFIRLLFVINSNWYPFSKK